MMIYLVAMVVAGLMSAVVPARPAHAATARVYTGTSNLNVRSGPATDKSVVGSLKHGSTISVDCQVWGQRVDGRVRTSPYWLRIGKRRYVSEAYVSWSGHRPRLRWCATEPAGATTARVTVASGTLNVRTGPSTSYGIARKLSDGTTLHVHCQRWGQHVSGNSDSAVWLRIGTDRFVSAAYVTWSPKRPWLRWCGQQPPRVPPSSNAAFIQRTAPGAQDGRDRYGVPASVTIAQAILETGWGSSGMAREDHNYFGMKCFGGPGPIALGCRTYGTDECAPTGCYATRADFRAYRNVTFSFRDHGRQLSTMSRYATAMEYTDHPNRFAREIHDAGYATDPKYSDKLIGLMKDYNLYRYDR